jgi:hypothetical protein
MSTAAITSASTTSSRCRVSSVALSGIAATVTTPSTGSRTASAR